MNELIKKIISRGYWKVSFNPKTQNLKLIPNRLECKKLITENKLDLRGWDYPHIDHKSGIKNESDNSIFSLCDWPEGPMYEFWRFNQAGLFEHYFAMREDLRISPSKLKEFQEEFGTKNEKFLSILSTVYSVTEIYTFASKLYSKLDIEGIEITIELHDVKNRMLTFWDTFGRYLLQPYICVYTNGVITIGKDIIISKDDLISNSSDLALNAVIDIFQAFNWDTVTKNIFLEDQKKLLQKNL